MNVNHVDVDSQVLGQAVLNLNGFVADSDFESFEQDYLARYRPRYVAAKVPVEQVREIQALENWGFRFVETQLSGSIRLRARHNVEGYPYRFERVTTQSVLSEVLDIAGSSFDTDRFSSDPELGVDFSGRRYQEYVRRSFSEPDQAVYRLYDPADGRTLSFKTHKLGSGNEVMGFLNAVRADLKGSGLGLLADSYYFNLLLDEGRTCIRTAISASNRVMVRYLIGGGILKVEAIDVVVRKLYPKQ